MRYPLLVLLASWAMSLLGQVGQLSAQEGQEETYSISLVQTAEADKEVVQVDERKVLTESYKVRAGEHLWQLLRERGLLEKRNLQELLLVLKKLNPSLTNLDLVHPGETIVIPLTITPRKAGLLPAPKGPEERVPLEKLKDADLAFYTVKAGDTLIKVIKNRYDVPDREIHDEYLDLLKKMNPSLTDVNTIYPGQKIRLPIYSPQVVRMPIKEVPPPEVKEEVPKEERTDLVARLTEIFREMGLEWTAGGQHFIPLKSGGQINLKAESFPVLSLPNGNRVIVDTVNGLPEKMTGLITSNWQNYRIIRIERKDDLRVAVGKILSACGYPKVSPADEPVELSGDISVRVRADWVVQTDPNDPHQKSRVIAVTLLDPGLARTPAPLKNLLRDLGIRVVEYPTGTETPALTDEKATPLKAGGGPQELVEKLLELTGQDFSKGAEIPVYPDRKTDFNLSVKADFLLRLNERESVIDLSGIGPEIMSLLAERQFRILSISGDTRPPGVISRVLDFLGIPYDSNPLALLAAERDESRNILIRIPGITFTGREGQRILATGLPLPDALGSFLFEKGYRILEVSPSSQG
ncbi:MAG: LysM peptidoglycan-binding domain-containing protein [Deltaproteobacteria bacterium]|nr:LysM peptidoglycan-binding domain-containing protein [Deltaproteobacteria bacterium]